MYTKLVHVSTQTYHSKTTGYLGSGKVLRVGAPFRVHTNAAPLKPADQDLSAEGKVPLRVHLGRGPIALH